ncbi:MAG: glycosyltransferase [Chloroflexi bacterium AL-N10]|nr:glycosyltransferase [Chloroflexi bacterium AL-N1]NOK71107.1 glycosyltransferase [Chloroflexi bacterium AL-N10]NOK77355.1 glycosyltransferase [Chloroflexi bacterium AL-N5]
MKNKHMPSPSDGTPTVSIIVPVYNGGKPFHECLESITKAHPKPHELIVIADGDTDGSREIARHVGAQVIERSTPGGPAQARNLGARSATGDILFFVDADVTIPVDAVQQVQAAFQRMPQMAALIGSYDDTPSEPHFLSQYRNLLHHYTHQAGREEAFTFWGACGAIRREIFLELGGFNQQYEKPSIEDIELGYRLVEHGYTIRLMKELQIKHLKRWDAVSMLKTDFFQRALPWTDLILRSGQIPNDLNLQRSSRLSVVCAYGLIASLVTAIVRPRMLTLSAICAILLIWLNAALYRFFTIKRGVWFTVRVLPWHWLYFVYSGLAFGLGILRFSIEKHRK